MIRKRGRNEGAIIKRKDGRWEARLSLGYENGARKQKSFYGKKRSEVAEALNKAISERAQGLVVAVDKQTMSQFLAQWLEQSVKARVRPRTFEGWALIVSRHIVPSLGAIPVQKVGPQQIRELLNQKLANGLSPQTVRHIRTVLCRALREAMKFGISQEMPPRLWTGRASLITKFAL
jgi:integrase